MTYEEAIPTILKHEGGFTIDNGGPTMKGVTQEVYDRYRVQHGKMKVPVKLIQEEELHEIYRRQYWLEGRCDRIPEILRLTHFDFCVNAGTGRAALTLQVVANVQKDGVIGNKTVAALNAIPPLELLDAYTDARESFYTKLAAKSEVYARSLKSWLARNADCKRRSLALYRSGNNDSRSSSVSGVDSVSGIAGAADQQHSANRDNT